MFKNAPENDLKNDWASLRNPKNKLQRLNSLKVKIREEDVRDVTKLIEEGKNLRVDILDLNKRVKTLVQKLLKELKNGSSVDTKKMNEERMGLDKFVEKLTSKFDVRMSKAHEILDKYNPKKLKENVFLKINSQSNKPSNKSNNMKYQRSNNNRRVSKGDRACSQFEKNRFIIRQFPESDNKKNKCFFNMEEEQVKQKKDTVTTKYDSQTLKEQKNNKNRSPMNDLVTGRSQNLYNFFNKKQTDQNKKKVKRSFGFGIGKENKFGFGFKETPRTQRYNSGIKLPIKNDTIFKSSNKDRRNQNFLNMKNKFVSKKNSIMLEPEIPMPKSMKVKKRVIKNGQGNGVIDYLKLRNNFKGTVKMFTVYDEKVILKYNYPQLKKRIHDMKDQGDNDDNESTDSIVNREIKRGFMNTFVYDIQEAFRSKKLHPHKYEFMKRLKHYGDTLANDYKRVVRRSRSLQ